MKASRYVSELMKMIQEATSNGLSLIPLALLLWLKPLSCFWGCTSDLPCYIGVHKADVNTVSSVGRIVWIKRATFSHRKLQVSSFMGTVKDSMRPTI